MDSQSTHANRPCFYQAWLLVEYGRQCLYAVLSPFDAPHDTRAKEKRIDIDDAPKAVCTGLFMQKGFILELPKTKLHLHLFSVV